jgi:hypothetical protein
MRSAGFALTLLLVLSSFVGGQDEIGKFRFAKSRSLAGTTLHYVKTNIDGSYPEYISQFFADDSTMEAFKFHPTAFPAALVVAKMDWTSFSAAGLYSYRINSKTERPLFATIAFDRSRRISEVSIPTMRKEVEKFSIPLFLIHVYNFDLGSLNFSFPHLKDPEGSFVVGIADPIFSDSKPLAEYKGPVNVKFVANERRNGVEVRKYSIDGSGLQNRGGFIWTNRKTGWIEDIEIDLPDNPDWKSFKLKLIKAEQMTRPQWEKYILDQF